MRRITFLGLFAVLATGVLITGCWKGSQPPVEPPATGSKPAEQPSRTETVEPGVAKGTPTDLPGETAVVVELTPQEKYDAALLQALDLMAERKYADSLGVLKNAQVIQDTDQIRREITKVNGLIEQQAVAERTVKDIQTVVTAGKAQDASQLATAGLQQFGGTDTGVELAKLKREADALTATDSGDTAARRARYRQEGEAALGERNLRAAAIAFEQVLQLGDDPLLRRQLDDIQATLVRYDDNRRRAAELRRDPASLEEAIAALDEAARAWDTLQIRQEIDAYRLALSKRRDRISVADFEVRGDIGMPVAGRTIAEELLPAFKPRFNLVERSQLGKVVAELRLEASDLADNDAGQQELGRLARIRYLVLGSVTPFCGITVNARLVDVRTGLIVQTAKIVVRTPQEIVPRLPQLAAMLMMTDEQKMAYEQQLAQRAVAEVRPVAIVALPPPPEPPVVGQPLPPPVVVYTPRPPDVGGVVVADFERLPARGTSLAVAIERDSPYKHRALHIALELGDNLFRRGRYREAHTQFELALNLSPGHKEIAFRIERCKPYVPPPPPPPLPSVVVIAPPPAIVVAPRPRVAVFNFIVNADPGYAPPGIGDWAAESMAAHFAPTYEVVDRGAVFWYMGRLGLTVRDVLVDASARLYLSRALNVRYFAFGVVQQTASFNVTTHLVDAETGAKQGSGSIHVQDHQELKLRMAELAKQTRSDPAEVARSQQEAKESEQLVNEARRFVKAGQNERAIEVAKAGLRKYPNNIALRTLLEQAERQGQAATAEKARQQEAARRQAELAAAQRRQQELARQAEAARQQAAKGAAARGEAARSAQEQQRQRAAGQLLAQARQALDQGNPKQAVQLLESAAALKPSDAINRELARARSAVQELDKTRAAAEQRRQEAEARKQRDDLERARARAAEDRRRREAEELVRRKQTEAEEHKKAAEKKRLAELQRQQEEQQKRRDEFDRLSTQGQTAMTAKRYDEAVRAYTEALKIMPGDPAITKALQLARQAQEASKSPPKPQPKSETPKKPQPRTDPKPQPKPDTPSKPQPPVVSPVVRAEFNHQLQLGDVFEKQQKYPDAIKAYREALRLIPGDAKAKRSLEFAQKMDDGTKALNVKRFADAARSFEEALKLFPSNQDAAKALQKARQGRP